MGWLQGVQITWQTLKIGGPSIRCWCLGLEKHWALALLNDLTCKGCSRFMGWYTRLILSGQWLKNSANKIRDHRMQAKRDEHCQLLRQAQGIMGWSSELWSNANVQIQKVWVQILDWWLKRNEIRFTLSPWRGTKQYTARFAPTSCHKTHCIIWTRLFNPHTRRASKDRGSRQTRTRKSDGICCS